MSCTSQAASRIYDLLTTCSCLLLRANSYKKVCVNSNKARKRWDSKYIQERRRFLPNKARIEEKKSRLEILTREECTKHLGQMITMRPEKTNDFGWVFGINYQIRIRFSSLRNFFFERFEFLVCSKFKHTMWPCMCCGLFVATQFHVECCGVRDDIYINKYS